MTNVPGTTLSPSLSPALASAGASAASLYTLSTTGANVLTVGAGGQYASLSAAIAASHDGDIIAVKAGAYTNDTAVVNDSITIVGVGGMVNLVETQPLANEKGILVVNNNLTVANVSFSGAYVPDDEGANGAGIRYQGGNLTLINDSFTGNQDGFLGAPVDGLPANTVAITHCTFTGNGVADPASCGYGSTHNAYIGAVDRLTVTNSIFSNVAGVGHELKSRAYANTIENNVIADGTASASYSIDLPNGGNDLISGNYIEKGPNTPNHAIIHFGGEGFSYAQSSLTITGNTIVNEQTAGDATALLNQTMIAASVTGNVLGGLTARQIASGPVSASHNVNGQGQTLADSTSNQLLPSNFQVITGPVAQTVTLTAANSGVSGGVGRLTVVDPAGHVTVIGGPGGLVFTEAPTAGGSSIATAANSRNTVILTGQDMVQSRGADVITVGAGNATVLVTGSARIASGPGSNSYTVSGTAAITGAGGSDCVTLEPGGRATLAGTEAYLQLASVGGSCDVNALIAGVREQVNVAGGSVQLRSYGGALNLTTGGGAQGATIRLGAGPMNVQSGAADTIYAGSGTEMVQLSGGGQTVYAGTGKLAVYGMGLSATNPARVFGAGGSYRIDGDSGNIIYQGGAAASTVDAVLSNITLVGGGGRLTINGGSRDIVTGGSGGIVLNGGAADNVTTAAGSTNTLVLGGSDYVQSWGTDLINAGQANQALVVHGNAQIVGAQGSNAVTLLGTDTLTATGGNESVTVGIGANVVITSAAWTSITEQGASVQFTATGNPTRATVAVTGGSAQIAAGAGATLQVQTGTANATSVVLGFGPAVVYSNGTDRITAGAGADTVNVSGDKTVVTGGKGATTVNDTAGPSGHTITIDGGAGALNYHGGPSDLVFLGGSGNATIDGGWGVLNVTAGSGNTTLVGGGGGALQFVAGSGAAQVAVSAAGGTIELGPGATSVTEASYGGSDLYQFVAGHGGGSDLITGFRVGTDRLQFQGVSVASLRAAGGSTYLTLSDQTRVELIGVAHYPQA
jgi:hypothetical protein